MRINNAECQAANTMGLPMIDQIINFRAGLRAQNFPNDEIERLTASFEQFLLHETPASESIQ